MNAPTFTDVAVVGMHFREEIDAKAIVASFVPPVHLILERDHFNPHDTFAIKVIYDDKHIGYIERKQACFIAPWMDEGVIFSCVVTHLEERKNNLYPIATISPIEIGEIYELETAVD